MATVAGDVPGLYDLVVNVSGGNTTGFVFDDALESSLPFRTHKATYTYSPTFIERQNVQGDFGDNQQDFFLTATQKDWSLGEQQRYFRSTDEDSKRRYWTGTKVNLREPGSVQMRSDVSSVSFAASVAALCSRTSNSKIVTASSTNIYEVNSASVVTDLGAHGLGTTPLALVSDMSSVYISSTAAGTVGVRKLSSAGAFSTWSANGSDSLEFLNNTLYGYGYQDGVSRLYRYDTAGTRTTLFTWQGADSINSGKKGLLRAFGGKLLILREVGDTNLSELWIYDGTAPSLIARTPSPFVASGLCVSMGTVFLAGVSSDPDSSHYRPSLFYYSGGNLGLLWKSTSTSANSDMAVCEFDGGVVFGDIAAGMLLYYNAATGGIHTLGSYTATSATNRLATADSYLLLTEAATTGYLYPGSSVATTATLTTSLFDFESSLTKLFRGIMVEFDSATDGNGGTVDIAYRTGDVDGTYTSLATGVTSGTETTLSGISGKRISVKVTLNKGTSTNGPVLKRIMVRAAPILTRFKQREYILSCIGDPASEDRQILRDGMSAHPLAGRKQADQLVLAAASQTPLTLTDRFGTYTGIIETLEIYEQHANNDDPSASGSFVVKVATREI